MAQVSVLERDKRNNVVLLFPHPFTSKENCQKKSTFIYKKVKSHLNLPDRILWFYFINLLTLLQQNRMKIKIAGLMARLELLLSMKAGRTISILCWG